MLLKKIIQKIAYILYRKRGKSPGYDLEDWFKAEKLVMQARRIFCVICFFIWLLFCWVLFNTEICFAPHLLFLFIGGLLMINVWKLWNPERFSSFLTAVATIAIALATSLQVNISNKLAELEKINSNHNKTALEVEFRPYVALQLADPEKVYALRSGTTLMPTKVVSINVGKVPALSVEVTYFAEQTLRFDIKDANDITPGGTSYYTPDINIGDPTKYDNGDLNITLLATYSGNYDVDPRRYCTKTQLTFQKVQNTVDSHF